MSPSPVIEARPLPDGALLDVYRERGAYTDCFSIDLPKNVSLEQFVEAFYTTRLFKLERSILRLIGKGSSDPEALSLAQGATTKFAAWTVEQRTPFQLLMCDFRGSTRSWLMVQGRGAVNTRLHFGSAVVRKSGKPGMGLGYRAMLGFHKRYSRMLLAAAAKKVMAE